MEICVNGGVQGVQKRKLKNSEQGNEQNIVRRARERKKTKNTERFYNKDTGKWKTDKTNIGNRGTWNMVTEKKKRKVGPTEMWASSR